jgi:hypothetical protein
VPARDTAIANFWRGPRAVLAFSRIPPPWRPILYYTNVLLFVSAAATALIRFRAVKRELFVALAGLVLLAFFNLPFVLVSKPEQYHLIGLGGALAMSGCVAILAAGVLHHARWFAWAGGVALATSMLPGGRVLMEQYEPFSETTAHYDEIVRGWEVVPSELREAIGNKKPGTNRGPLGLGPGLPVVTYGVHGWETNPYGWRYRWTGSRAVLLVDPELRALVLPVSAAVMPKGEPVRLEILVDGETQPSVTLTTTGAVRVEVALAHVPRPWWRPAAMRWIEVSVTPTWVPRLLDPASTDDRTLGVMLGTVELVR